MSKIFRLGHTIYDAEVFACGEMPAKDIRAKLNPKQNVPAILRAFYDNSLWVKSYNRKIPANQYVMVRFFDGVRIPKGREGEYTREQDCYFPYTKDDFEDFVEPFLDTVSQNEISAFIQSRIIGTNPTVYFTEEYARQIKNHSEYLLERGFTDITLSYKNGMSKFTSTNNTNNYPKHDNFSKEVIIEELGDLLFYLQSYCDKHSIDLNEVAIKHLEKLKQQAINNNNDLIDLTKNESI